MKAATNTLRVLLSRHPGVSIPEREIGFFDIDEMENHPDFFFFQNGEWSRPAWEENLDELIEWYRGFFGSGDDDQILGEVSTTYLASRFAPERMAEIIPGVKLIFLLRDPVDRAYSHYWHNVSAGRATRTFEETLRTSPGAILRRSTYYPFLERYYDVFPDDQIHCIIFEEFISDMNDTLHDLRQFLGLDTDVTVDEKPHRHKTRAPWSLSLRLLLNRMFRLRLEFYYHEHLPYAPDPPRLSWVFQNVLYRSFRFLLDGPARDVPPIRSKTRDTLESYFREANRGLQALLDRDLGEHWPWFDRSG